KVAFDVTASPDKDAFKVKGSLKITWDDFDINEPMFFNVLRVYDGFTVRINFLLPYALFNKDQKRFTVVSEKELELVRENIRKTIGVVDNLGKLFSQGYKGKCTLMPEKYLPLELKSAVKKKGYLSWDEGCQVRTYRRKDKESANVTNRYRVLGEYEMETRYKCFRSYSGEKAGQWNCKAISGKRKLADLAGDTHIQSWSTPVSCEKAEGHPGNQLWKKLAEFGLEIEKGKGCQFSISRDSGGSCVPEKATNSRESILVNALIGDGRRVFAECKRDAVFKAVFFGIGKRKCVWRKWYCSWTESTW
ncbi:MAG: hypothetical protein HQK84_12635, partial [Nitrospinae bacterium]|nr:hypothetical protein [Nitrospinota bacterium]